MTNETYPTNMPNDADVLLGAGPALSGGAGEGADGVSEVFWPGRDSGVVIPGPTWVFGTGERLPEGDGELSSEVFPAGAGESVLSGASVLLDRL